MKALGPRLYYWLPPLAWAGAIFYLSSRPSFPRPLAYPHEDKVLHALFFGILALWLFRALSARLGLAAWRSAALAFVLASLYGGLDEIHQYFVPTRSMEAADWLADTAGAAVAVLAAWMVKTNRQRL
ncbi:MAG: VanZ family protein [Kiritimatiellae bacterium]|nr:VanZ family protein [Kiritimatiellia bacterium]